MAVDATSPTEREIAVAYLDAIRLANEGAADDIAFPEIERKLTMRRLTRAWLASLEAHANEPPQVIP